VSGEVEHFVGGGSNRQDRVRVLELVSLTARRAAPIETPGAETKTSALTFSAPCRPPRAEPAG